MSPLVVLLPWQPATQTAVLALHEPRDHVGALDDRDAAAMCFVQLGVVGRGGRGRDDEAGWPTFAASWADTDLRTERLDRVHQGRAALVRAGDLVAPGQKDAGDGRHVHAADADEVDALGNGLGVH